MLSFGAAETLPPDGGGDMASITYTSEQGREYRFTFAELDGAFRYERLGVIPMAALNAKIQMNSFPQSEAGAVLLCAARLAKRQRVAAGEDPINTTYDRPLKVRP